MLFVGGVRVVDQDILPPAVSVPDLVLACLTPTLETEEAIATIEGDPDTRAIPADDEVPTPERGITVVGLLETQSPSLKVLDDCFNNLRIESPFLDELTSTFPIDFHQGCV